MFWPRSGARPPWSLWTTGLRTAPCWFSEAARSDGFDVDVVAKAHNAGYGAALRTGVERAHSVGAQWVLFMDSDLTNPPADILTLASGMAGAVDVVKACRYCNGGGMVGVPLGRRMFSRVGNVVARLLVGPPHRDPTNGFRAFRTDRYLELPVRDSGFSVILEELHHARRAGLRGVDVPSTLTSRAQDLRPTSFRYSPGQIWAYLRWPLRTALDRLGSMPLVRR